MTDGTEAQQMLDEQDSMQQGQVDFSSLRRFRNSLTAKVLVRYCSLNFI